MFLKKSNIAPFYHFLFGIKKLKIEVIMTQTQWDDLLNVLARHKA